MEKCEKQSKRGKQKVKYTYEQTIGGWRTSRGGKAVVAQNECQQIKLEALTTKHMYIRIRTTVKRELHNRVDFHNKL